MSLRYEEFSSQAQKFVEISDLLDDGWQLREDPYGVQYLYKKVFLSTTDDLNQCARQYTERESDFNDAQVDDDEGDNRETYLWEYNVVHSVSYQVPALYFNVARLGCATVLSLEEVWNFCKEYGSVLGVNKEDLWSTITQQEHPVTAVPHFVLHPCNTQKMMQQLYHPKLFEKENYLLTWLSSFGPAVGIRMPLDYIRFAQQSR